MTTSDKEYFDARFSGLDNKVDSTVANIPRPLSNG